VPFLLHPYVSFYTTRGCPRSVPSACGRKPFPGMLADAFDGKCGARGKNKRSGIFRK